MKLKILHTNDLHSRFENFARVVSSINQIKDENTVLLDAGDFNDFMRIELEGTDGHAGVELLDIAGYDAIAVGNNETFQGIEMLSKMAGIGNVPFLSCNLLRNDLTPIPGLKNSVIIKKSGVRFLIIGTSPCLGVFYTMSGMDTVDFKTAIREEITANKGRYDICILLSHLGLCEDRDIADTLDGIDIIIDGHSHILMGQPEKIKNTIIHQSGFFGQYLGVLEVDFEDGIQGFKGQNINVENMIQDLNIMNSINKNKEIAIDCLSMPLCNINIDLWHDIVEENPMTNLLADALRDTLKCEIGIINSGVLNGGIRKGTLSKKKLLEICPSPLNPTYIEIQGKNIKNALEKSLYGDICLQEGMGSGFRGRYLGRLHVSGMSIEHNGRHIIKISVNGRELEEERWYTAATSDYLKRGSGYTDLSKNRNEKYNAEYLRDMLRDYLKRQDFLDGALMDRWVTTSL